MKQKYVVIYGVPCKNIQVLTCDKYGVRIQYTVKHGRKSSKCWIDYRDVSASPVLTNIVREFKRSK